MQQVDADPTRTHTIGVHESWSRPELIMLDLQAELQVRLIRSLAADHVRSELSATATAGDFLRIVPGPSWLYDPASSAVT
jgi:hypothetical protein